ncbi:amino acid adenylation domain-containing protein [Kitasatospora sp. NPDC058170]|uniref:non-ribosomal peptide synthetase n=1 Tax=Kitasatospora sp. NPDC058170 TaxID=3346364 RepID=UPI0036DCAA4C
MHVAHGAGIPLTQQQETVWKAQLMAPTADSYHIPLAFRLTGPITPQVLDQALLHVVARHPVLRTAIVDGPTDEPTDGPGPGPLQFVQPPPASVLAVHATTREQATALLAETATLPFDPAAPLRLAAHLFRWAPDEALLLLVFDHVAVDAPSVAMLLTELSRHCAEPPAPGAGAPPEEGYFAYALEQRDRFARPDAETAEGAAFWTARVTGLDTGAAARTGRDTDGPAGELVVDLPAGLTPAVTATGGSLFTVLMTAYCLALRHLSPAADVLVSYPAIDPWRADYEDAVGLFTDMLLLRAPDLDDRSLSGYAAEVREELLAGFEHQGAPLAGMHRALRIAGTEVRAMLSVHDVGAEELTLPGTAVERVPIHPRTGKIDLLLAVEVAGERTRARLQYRRDRHTDEQAGTIAAAFRVVLEALAGIAAGVDPPAARVELLPRAERERVLALAHGPAAAAFVPVTRAFLEHARRSPRSTAVLAGGERLDYGGLERASARIADRLHALGLPRGSTVALCVPRSAGYVTAALGVLRSGHAFLPVDPELPRTRLGFVLADADAAAVVVETAGDAAALGGRLPTVALDEPVLDAPAAAPSPAGPAPDAEEPDAEGPGPADAAYVITTSGSTGLPKSVRVPHRALANNLRWKADTFGFTAADRFHFKTPPVFDASVWEYLAPLTVGASVVVAPAWAHRDPAALAAEIAGQGVTVVQFVPTLLKALLAEPAPTGGSRVRAVFSGGEALDAAVAERAALWFGAPVVNLYGPAETAIDVTSHTVPADGPAGRVPIGRPAAGAQVHVLGRGGQLLPAGVPGELWVGGVPLADGYVNRRELTEERFVPHPFDPDPRARLYRTGDLGVRRADGTLEFLGRVDGQVKLRGIRLELDEIRAVALDHPEVRDAVARLVTAGREEVLALYFLGEHPDTRERLRAHLAERLPAALRPGPLIPLDAFPLTGSGKVDIRALPAPPPAAPPGPADLPRSETERRIAARWAEALGTAPEQVPRDVSLFELGGSSLTLIRLHRLLRTEFGTVLPITDLFSSPTVAAVAEALKAAGQHEGSS